MAHPIHNELYQPKLDLSRIQSLISSDPSCVHALNRQNGYMPLHAAARRGDSQLLQLLVVGGAPLEARTSGGSGVGVTAFLMACQVTRCEWCG